MYDPRRKITPPTGDCIQCMPPPTTTRIRHVGMTTCMTYEWYAYPCTVGAITAPVLYRTDYVHVDMHTRYMYKCTGTHVHSPVHSRSSTVLNIFSNKYRLDRTCALSRTTVRVEWNIYMYRSTVPPPPSPHTQTPLDTDHTLACATK